MSDWRKRAEPVVTGWRARAEPVRALPPLATFDESGTQARLQAVEKEAQDAARAADVGVLEQTFSPKSKLGTVLRSASRGVASGFNDEISGALGAGYDGLSKLSEYMGASPDDPYDAAHPEERPSMLDVYRRERDATRRETDAGAKENPALSKTVEIAAGLFTPPVGKGGKTAAALFQQGAKTAALSGLGNSSADLTQGDVGTALLDTGLSAGLGGVGSMVLGKGAQKVGEKAAPWLARRAEEQALKAGFGGGNILNKLQERGYETEEEAAQLGREMLDKGMVRFIGDEGKVAARAKALRQAAGQEAGDVLRETGQTGIPADFERAAWDMVGAVHSPPNRPGLNAEELLPKNIRQVSGLANSVRKTGDRVQFPMTPEESWGELNVLKSDAWKNAKFNPTADTNKAQVLYKRGVAGLRDSIADQVEEVGGADAANRLRSANARFGPAADVEALANDAATRAAKNKNRIMAFLSAATMGGAGGMSGGTHTGVAGAALGLAPFAAKAVFSPNRLAVGADALSNYAANAGTGSGAAKMARAGIEEWRRYLLEHSAKPGDDEAKDHFLDNG
jgi:hypothetical protein